jgi:kumamolisin
LIPAYVAIPKKARLLGWLSADRMVDFTIVLSRRTSLPPAEQVSTRRAADGQQAGSNKSLRPGMGPKKPSTHLTHAELWQTYGPAADCVEMIESFARRFGLEITEMPPQRRSIRLRGRAADVARAFKTRFAEFEMDRCRFFAAVREPRTPARWKTRVEAVLGLHNLPRSAPRRRSMAHRQPAVLRVNELAQTYGFPAHLDGAGQTIGLIEFGGGFRRHDIAEFCRRMGVDQPRITVVKVGSGANRPASRKKIGEFLDAASGTVRLSAEAMQEPGFEDGQGTVEVTMDLEIVAALVPRAHIVVYFAAPTEQGLYHAINRAVHDRRHRPSVLSISWSVPEQSLPAGEVQAIESVLCEAAHLGITVCASTGDSGALNGAAHGKPSVNYPASSPHCLACGGTSRRADARGTMLEVVWNATHHGIHGASGGGVSVCFPRPRWQELARVPAAPNGRRGRGLPDVAGLADPRYGCEMWIAGRPFASAGTSCVAPLWAALIARYNQGLGRRCGYLNPQLYRLGEQQTSARQQKKGLRPVTRGNNGFYRAGKGWNPCAGYGTPRGEQLLAHLAAPGAQS